MSTVFGLDEHERSELLGVARTAIVTGLSGDPLPSVSNLPPKLHAPCGAFVTLHKGGQLRGCIGRIKAADPLSQTIQQMARHAAFADPRFKPVTLPEVPEIDLEISVLSPFETIPAAAVNTIVVGKHGLYITAFGRSGLLLPQVAPEWKWNTDEFLAQTCTKAGLPTDTWKRPEAQIEIFTAEVFGEHA